MIFEPLYATSLLFLTFRNSLEGINNRLFHFPLYFQSQYGIPLFQIFGPFVISSSSSRRYSNSDQIHDVAIYFASSLRLTVFQYQAQHLPSFPPSWCNYFIRSQTCLIMVSKTSLLSLFAASLSLFSPVKALSDVLDLSTADFDETVKENPLVLAEFFAPWVCFPCKEWW